MKPKIFKCTDKVEDMLQDLTDDGLIGIDGSTTTVDGRMRELKKLLERDGLYDYNTASSINHPHTNLGVAFCHARFTLTEAHDKVLESYNSSNP